MSDPIMFDNVRRTCCVIDIKTLCTFSLNGNFWKFDMFGIEMSMEKNRKKKGKIS